MIAFFDVETTGLDVNRDRICDFGIVIYDDDGTFKKQKGDIINPEMIMSKEVIRIHKITNRMARHGKDWEWYAKHIIIPTWNAVDCVAGHNINFFDLPMLKSNVKRVGLELPDVPSLDTLVFTRRFLPNDIQKKKTLGAIAKFMNVQISKAHRALPDARANGDLFFKLLKKFDLTLEEAINEEAVTLGPYAVGRDPFEAIFCGQR